MSDKRPSNSPAGLLETKNHPKDSDKHFDVENCSTTNLGDRGNLVIVNIQDQKMLISGRP